MQELFDSERLFAFITVHVLNDVSLGVHKSTCTLTS